MFLFKTTAHNGVLYGKLTGEGSFQRKTQPHEKPGKRNIPNICVSQGTNILETGIAVEYGEPLGKNPCWPLLELLRWYSTSHLTHWGRVTHICVGTLTIIGSDNGLSPSRHQAIIWTNAELLLIGPLGTNLNETLIKTLAFSFKKMRLKVSSVKWRPSCLGLNVLSHCSSLEARVPVYQIYCVPPLPMNSSEVKIMAAKATCSFALVLSL